MYNLNYTGYNKRNRRKQKTAEESGIKQKKTEAVEERGNVMPEKMGMTWQEALQKLKNGNEKWLKEREGRTGNVSVQSVKNHMSGQAPYAVVVTC